MDYGDIFRRSWNIIWKNKFMLFLGFLAALGSGTSFNGGGGNSGSSGSFDPGSGDFPEGMPFDPNMIDQFGTQMEEFWIAFGALFLVLICVGFIVGIILWLVRLTAQAGMIDAASRLDAGEEVTLGAALSAGWQRLMGMVGLDLVIAAIFILFGIVMAVLVFLMAGAGAFSALESGDPEAFTAIMGSISIVFLCVCCLACLFIPISILIGVVKTFAQRALVLENKGVFAAFSRSWQVVKANAGPIVILLIVFLLLGLLVGAVMLVIFIPVLAFSFGPLALRFFGAEPLQFIDFLMVCGGILFMWLVGALIQAVLTSFSSTVYTLAYQEFTNKSLDEKAAA